MLVQLLRKKGRMEKLNSVIIDGEIFIVINDKKFQIVNPDVIINVIHYDATRKFTSGMNVRISGKLRLDSSGSNAIEAYHISIIGKSNETNG